jgi:hypothetical protein
VCACGNQNLMMQSHRHHVSALLDVIKSSRIVAHFPLRGVISMSFKATACVLRLSYC